MPHYTSHVGIVLFNIFLNVPCGRDTRFVLSYPAMEILMRVLQCISPSGIFTSDKSIFEKDVKTTKGTKAKNLKPTVVSYFLVNLLFGSFIFLKCCDTLQLLEICMQQAPISWSY